MASSKYIPSQVAEPPSPPESPIPFDHSRWSQNSQPHPAYQLLEMLEAQDTVMTEFRLLNDYSEYILKEVRDLNQS